MRIERKVLELCSSEETVHKYENHAINRSGFGIDKSESFSEHQFLVFQLHLEFERTLSSIFHKKYICK